MWLPPGQMSTAVVTCVIPQQVQIGAQDKITFTTRELSVTSQSAVLTVTSPSSEGAVKTFPELIRKSYDIHCCFFLWPQDRRRPVIWWNYGSRCEGRLGSGRCAESVWSLEITTADYDSGILRVQSSPKGLLLRDTFIAGTKREVKASYTASCCSPRVTVTSYDLAGNQKSITIDVSDYIFGPAEIAAITLGVILLLVLIGAIIGLIVYCCKKRRDSRDLPVFRSRLERERNP